jgi:hypothetical protein
MVAAGGGGALVSLQKGRIAHVCMRRNFYSDSTAKRFGPVRATSGAGWLPHWGIRMEPIELLPRSFTNLLREDAGMSFMEFALIGALVLVVCLLLLLAVRRSA